MTVSLFQGAEKSLQIGVPTDAETVVPSTENGIPGLQLQVGFPEVAPEAAG